MTPSRRIQKLRPLMIASLLALPFAASWAARDFTPQAGTWVISEELDGKPGRGLAIDVQGNTFFMQVFGYEKNGDATFYTATGQMDGNAVTAPLMQYQGGRSFGSDARDAVELGSPGEVTVSFANGLQGSVQFPGEPQRAIQRFEVRSPQYTASYWDGDLPRTFLVTALDASNAPDWFATLGIRRNSLNFEWEAWIQDLRSDIRQTLVCKQTDGMDIYRCTGNGAQLPNAQAPNVQSMTFRIASVDVTGNIELQNQGSLNNHQLMGTAIDGNGGGTILGCVGAVDLYVGDRNNCMEAIVPSSGTWVAEDELTFKPGRGIALDEQNGVAMAQVFNYQQDGAATFRMGSGTYQGARTRFALNRYQGGRSLGGPPLSAELAQATGDLGMDFLYGGQTRRSLNRVRGNVEFPNEPKKPFMRLALEPGASTAEGLLGQWWLRFYPADYQQRELKAVTLTRVEDTYAVSEDGLIRCTRHMPDSPRSALCLWNRDGVEYSAYLFQEAGNRSSTVLQVRDRHGNLTGLGNVPLE